MMIASIKCLHLFFIDQGFYSFCYPKYDTFQDLRLWKGVMNIKIKRFLYIPSKVCRIENKFT